MDRRHFLAALGGLSLAACAPRSRLLATWSNPDAGRAVSLAGLEIAAYVWKVDPQRQLRAETELARQIDALGARGVAYGSIVGGQRRDESPQEILRRLDRRGTRAIAAMRYIATRSEPQLSRSLGWTPVHGDIRAFIDSARAEGVDPALLARDQRVHVETLVYDVGLDRPLWAGRSETLNPASVEDLVERVSRSTVGAMRADGLLPGA